MRETLAAKPLEGYPSEIGIWLWAMEETRKKTKAYVVGIDQDIIDWAGLEDNENGIGTLLYHLAIVEMGWLHFDTLGQPERFPKEDFPFEPLTEGRITPVMGISLDDHLARLERCRAIFLERIKEITLTDWLRLRSPEGEDYEVSPAWMGFHLVEHEAGHAAQIGVMKKRARAAKYA